MSYSIRRIPQLPVRRKGESKLNQKRVIIDTDPGIDDSMALLLAFRSPELDVAGLTVVAGNIDVENGARNAVKVCQLAGVDVPIAVGAADPLVQPLKTAPFIHGEDGLGDLLPPPEHTSYDPRFAPQFLVEEIMSGGVREIIALGPLTNIAIALTYEPRLRERLDRIVIMGGSVRREGNTNPGAEFNFFTDPEAARIVFRSGIPLTLIGLNVTMKTVFPHEYTTKLLSLGEQATPIGRFVGEITDFYARHYRQYYGLDGWVMHDPLTVGVAIDPSFVRTQHAHVDIELRGELTRGQSVADFWQMPRPWGEPNCDVALEVDVERFVRYFAERVVPEVA